MNQKCTKCLITKTLDCFQSRSSSNTKLRSHCKTCRNKASVSYNKKFKLKTLSHSKSHREKSKTHPELRYSSFKSRMKEMVSLSKEEYVNIFKNDPKCIYCNCLIRGIGSGLDRIDNAKGYTVDNVNPCCGTCNDIRGNNLSVEEMKVAMKAIIDFRKNING